MAGTTNNNYSSLGSDVSGPPRSPRQRSESGSSSLFNQDFNEIFSLWSEDNAVGKVQHVITVGCFGASVLVMIITACAAPLHTGRNLFLVFTLGVSAICHFYLCKWYRQGLLDPKVQRVLVTEAVVFVALTIATSLVVFAPDCPEIWWRNCMYEEGKHCLNQETNICVPCPT